MTNSALIHRIATRALSERGVVAGIDEQNSGYHFRPYYTKGDPYFVNQKNPFLKKLKDPATWNYLEAMRYRETLNDKLEHGAKDPKEEAALQEATRQITNWGLLAVKQNPDQVDRDSGRKPRRPKKPYDYPEYKSKSSPYYVNRRNPFLKPLGDPATWNVTEAYRLKDKLNHRLEQGDYEEGKEEDLIQEATRQIGNWFMLALKNNRDQVDRDNGHVR